MAMRPNVRLAKRIDNQLAHHDHARALRGNQFGWSRSIREAIGLPLTQLAQRMKISQPAITKLEQNEAAGNITVAKLEALAEALDCEFVYGFIPKRPFAETAQERRDDQDKARKAHRKVKTADPYDEREE